MAKRKITPAQPAATWNDPAWAGALLVLVPALCAAALLLTRLNDLDIWIHLAVGRWVAAHHAVPTLEPFSYTALGRPWIPYEWLSELFFYAVYSLAGLDGLVLLKAAFVLAVTAAAVLQSGSRRTAALAAAGPAMVLAVCAARSSLLERPQLFTYLLTSLYLLLLKRGEKKPTLLWALVLLQIAWVNLHGAACLMGLALIGCWLTGTFIPTEAPPEPGLRKRLGLVLGLCAAASFVNPFGWRVFAELFRVADPRYAELIREWSPLHYDAASRPIWMPLTALEVLSSAAWLLNGKRRAAEGLAWAAFFALSWRGFRFATESALVFGQLFAGEWGALAGSWRPRWRQGWAVLVLSLAASAGTAWGFAYCEFNGFFQPGLGTAPNASRAIAYLEKAGLNGPLFNDYNFGGQLLWFAPARPVFVDGRNLEYGADLLTKAMHWFEPAVWSVLDSQYGFQIALVGNGPYYTCAVLDGDPRWRLVYWDDEALVYIRADGPNAAAATQGYKRLKPNATGFEYLSPLLDDPRTAAETLEEARRAAAAAPDSLDARLLEAFLLRKLGRSEEAVTVLLEAAEHAPDAPESAYALAFALQSAGRYEEAAPLYRKAASRASRFGPPSIAVNAWCNLGSLLYRQGNRTGASALWRQALELDPNNAVARHNLATVGTTD